MLSPQQIQLQPPPNVSTRPGCRRRSSAARDDPSRSGLARRQRHVPPEAPAILNGQRLRRQLLRHAASCSGTLPAAQARCQLLRHAASCSGTLPVLDGSGVPRMSVQYSSADPRLRQLDAVLTAADGTAVASWQHQAECRPW